MKIVCMKQNQGQARKYDKKITRKNRDGMHGFFMIL